MRDVQWGSNRKGIMQCLQIITGMLKGCKYPYSSFIKAETFENQTCFLSYVILVDLVFFNLIEKYKQFNLIFALT